MIKIAIVGTGIIGLSHINAIKQIEDCELVCLCDVNEEVVKPLAEENNVPYVLKPDLNQKSGAAYFDAKGSGKPSEIEAYQWIQAVINDTDALVKPEEAYTVTRILEGIYKSAESGDIFRF